MYMILNALNKLAFVVAPIFYTLLYLSITAIAVGCVLLLIRRITDKKISPNWKYAMWICLILALVLPVRLQSDFSLMGKTGAEEIQGFSYRERYNTAKYEAKIFPQQAEYNGSPANQQTANELSQKADTLYLKSLIFDVLVPLIWLFGTITLFMFMLIGAIRLRQKISKGRDNIDYTKYYSILDRCKSRLKINKTIEIVIQDTIKTPALFGLLYPNIVLPSYADQMSDESIEYIFLHELAHYKRCDMWVNYLLLTLQAVYWFNPLIWLFFKFLRQDLELACDAYVLKFMDKEGHKKYSLSLVGVLGQYAKPRLVPKLLCMVDNESNLKRRIKMIKLNEVFKKQKLLIATTSVLIIGIVGVLFLTTGSSKEIPPIYLHTEYSGSAQAIKGGYSWDYGSEQVVVDALSANQMEYTVENTLTIERETQIVISNQKLKLDKRYPYNLVSLKSYSKDGSEKDFDPKAFSFHNGDLYINAPKANGEYIFDIALKYKQGTAHYGFKVVVRDQSSNVSALFSNKTNYVGDNSKVGGIINSLSFSTKLIGDGFELHTSSEPYGVTANFTTNTETIKFYDDANNQATFKKNAIIMFSLIGNVENITFRLTDGKSKVTLNYPRQMADDFMGKDVREFSKTQDEFANFISVLDSKLQDNNYSKAIGLWQGEKGNTNDAHIVNNVEEKLKVIMSSPQTSSNPQDYINAHQNEYHTIWKMGDDALNYMLSEFEKGNQTGLKGHIMMALCIDMLGDRIDKSTAQYATGQDWFNNSVIYQKTKLKPYKVQKTDPIEQLVYNAAIGKYPSMNDGITIIAPKIHDVSYEGNKIKIFVTVYECSYHLYGKNLKESGGGIIPAAITYTKKADGSFTLDEYLQAEDGSGWTKSIQGYCKTPVTGKRINGLYDKIIKYYSDYSELFNIKKENLKQYLLDNNLDDVKVLDKGGRE